MRFTNMNHLKKVSTIPNPTQIFTLPLLNSQFSFEAWLAHFRKMPTQLKRTNSEAVKMERERLMKVVLTTRSDEDLGLVEVEVEGKGRGVRALIRFAKGDPVVEYKGQIMSVQEGRKREAKISPDFANIFYSQTFSKSKCAQSFCVDASKEVPGRFGRLVNHSHKNPNCHIEVVDSFKGSPHLVLVAARDIETGEEITIDYGVTDREVLEANPWLRQS